jgi:tetratricopeptide (TPR) repeat protein
MEPVIKTAARRLSALLIWLLLLCAVLGSVKASLVWSQVPTNAPVHIDRAVVAYEQKRYDDALKELQEALRAEPQNVEALYYLGVVYLTLNRPSEGQAALEKGLALRPGNADFSFQLGISFFNQQDYDKAEPLLRQVFQVEPTRPNLGYYLGFIEYRKKNYREALALLKANIPSDDSFDNLAHFYSGLAMTALGFPREGRVALNEAMRLQPVSPLTTPAQRFGEILDRAAEEKRRFVGGIRLGVLYDTNVPALPSGGTDVASQAVRQSQARKDSSGELAAVNMTYVWLRNPDWPDWEGAASYGFLQTYYNYLPQFNQQIHTPTLGLTYTGSLLQMPYAAGSLVTYEFTLLGNSKYSERWIVNPYFTLSENQSNEFSNATTLQYRFQHKNFFNDREVIKPPPVGISEVRDANNYMIGPLHVFRFANGRHLIQLGYQYDFEDAQGKDWTYSGQRALAGGQYTLSWGDIRLVYNLDLQWRAYKYNNSLIPVSAPNTKKRKDQEFVNVFSVAKDFFTDFSRSFPLVGCNLADTPNPSQCPFTGSIDYVFDDNKSNFSLYSYKRNVVTTSFTWRF